MRLFFKPFFYLLAATTSVLMLHGCGQNTPAAHLHVYVDEINTDDFHQFLQSWEYRWEGEEGNYRVGYVGDPIVSGAELIADFYEYLGLSAGAGSWAAADGVIWCCNLARSHDAYFRLRYGEDIYEKIAENMRSIFAGKSYFSRYSTYFEDVEFVGGKFVIRYSATTPDKLRVDLTTLTLSSSGTHLNFVDIVLGEMSQNRYLGLSGWKEEITRRTYLSFGD